MEATCLPAKETAMTLGGLKTGDVNQPMIGSTEVQLMKQRTSYHRTTVVVGMSINHLSLVI